jgi:hypothetical protein
VADFRREEEAFNQKREQHQMMKDQREQQMAAAGVKNQFDRDKFAFEQQKHADEMANPSAGKSWEKIAIADKMDRHKAVLQDPNASDEDKRLAISQLNSLASASKTFSKGVEYGSDGDVQQIGGYGVAAGSLDAESARRTQQAKQDVDLEMRPKIERGVSLAKARAAGEEKSQSAQPFKAGVSTTLQKVAADYRKLKDLNSTVSPTQSTLTNIGARIRSSEAGQWAEGFLGTETQNLRDQIAMTRPALVNDIRNATGMSAKAMDSNVELKFYLQTATDPNRSFEANMAALSVLDQKYGLSLGLEADPEELQRVRDSFRRENPAPAGGEINFEDLAE